MTLDEMLLSWRTANGFSQEEAAEACGITRAGWGMIEQGRRFNLRDETFESIALGTGLSVERLRHGALQSKLRDVNRQLRAVPA